MFQSARLKLTVWYLLILMVISIVFSGVIYSNVATQIEGLIHSQNERVQHYRHDQEERLGHPDADDPPIIPTEELQNQKNELLLSLILINGAIVIVAGGAAYFLAGRTLYPIKKMIDEQNQFISSSSHELRTPLATMRTEMETGLLEKHISDKEARKLIKSSLEEIGSLQTLSNSLLTLAQVHNVNPFHFADDVSLKESVARAVKKVSPLAEKKHIAFSQDVEDATLEGEKNSLAEVFVILFENAIKYSPEKTIIKIRSEKSHNTIKIFVQDQGMGIKEEDLPHVFERFYRADKSRHQEGFGLGLSIAKKTVESHGGTIHVQSSTKQGTTFIVSLPLRHV